MRLVLAIFGSLAAGAIALAGTPPDPVETHVVQTGRAPCGTAAAGGAVWVGVYETGQLLRIDADSGRITRRITVGDWACRVALDDGVAWVTRDRAGKVARVDLKTGAVRQLDLGASPFDAVVAFGSVWVTSFDVGTVARLERQTGKLRRVYKFGSSPAGITSCAGRIWVGHGRLARYLTSIDPATHRLTRVRVRTQTPGWPRCVRGELWVTAPQTVLKIDARTGTVLARVDVGGTPAEAAAGPDGLVWVTDKERALVHRVYARGAVVVGSFPAGPGAFSLVRAEEAMWITSFAGSDIRRYTQRR